MEKQKLIQTKEKTSDSNHSIFDDNPESRARLNRAIKILCTTDPKLADIIKRVGACEMVVRPTHNPFNTLARSIIYQQLHGKAAAAIHARLIATVASKRVLTPQDVLAASDETLRAVGLSGSKSAALRDLAARTLDGTVPSVARLRRMSDEEIIAHLTIVRGIGRWTVEMLLMSRLGRPDVLPVGDFAIRKSIGLMDGMERMPTPGEAARRGELWQPFRTVASWYLWRALDIQI